MSFPTNLFCLFVFEIIEVDSTGKLDILKRLADLYGPKQSKDNV